MELRCRHEMLPEYCGICRGQVTAENQTQIFGDEYEAVVARIRGKQRPIAPITRAIDTAIVHERVNRLREAMNRRKAMEASEKKCLIGKEDCKKIVGQGLCHKHYDQWRSGNSEMIKAKGGPFTSVHRGPARVKKARAAAVAGGNGKSAARKKSPRASAPAPKPTAKRQSNGEMSILINLGRYPQVFQALEEQAEVNIRTPAEQALFYVVAALKEEEAHV